MRCETKRPAGAIGRDCRACARNICQEPSEVNISSTCKVGQKLGSVSPSVDMLPLGVTIPATVPQGSEIPEGLMNNPVRSVGDGTVGDSMRYFSVAWGSKTLPLVVGVFPYSNWAELSGVVRYLY